MKKVLIPLAQGCEELEAVTIIDLLRRAKIDVTTASLDDDIIIASRGTRLLADKPLDTVLDETFDMVILPGGLPGADNLNNDGRIHQLLKRQSAENKLLGAICAAPKVLAHAGLLTGKKATSYPGALDAYQKMNINETGSAIEIDGNVITSRGPGTAMDFALQLIELLTDKDTRDTINKQLVRS